MKFDLDIKGIDQVNKILSQLPKDINTKVQKDINMKAAKIAADTLKRNAPSGNSTKKPSNQIENNIKVVAKPGTQQTILVGLTKTVFYAKFIEFGTKVRKVLGRNDRYKGANRGKVTARPFIARSFDQASNNIISFMNTNYLKLVNASIKKHIKKLK